MGSGEEKGDHLCVLVHGLWGNPSHLKYLYDSIRARYDSSVLRILVCQRNAGNFTYDGIETGGERVAREIEDSLEDYAREGVEIRKISIVGYSLGGLVSRYAIGLLYSKGYFDKRLTPVNFTTFATPHLGVRTPLLGWHNHIWNVIGARTLSASGRQLFMIDKFRNTNRPLLLVLAEKESVFYKALSMFSNKVLYANIVNDRATCFYTAAISTIDPFADLSAVNINYLPNYSPIVIDPENMVTARSSKEEKLPISNRISNGTQEVARFPVWLVYAFIVPIGITIFLFNAVIQTIFSNRRIRLHLNEQGFGYHTIPLWAEQLLQEAEEAVIDDMHEMSPQHLPNGSEEQSCGSDIRENERSWPLTDSMIGIKNNSAASHAGVCEETSVEQSQTEQVPAPEHKEPEDSTSKLRMEFPTLALAPAQFKMIHNLNQLGWRKFPIFIHGDRHSHAAIIVRDPKAKRFEEGKIVVSHWLSEAFYVPE